MATYPYHCLVCETEISTGSACERTDCQNSVGVLIAEFEAGIPADELSDPLNHVLFMPFRWPDADADATHYDPFKNGGE